MSTAAKDMSIGSAVLLAHVEKPDPSSTSSQEYDVTLSDKLSNYAYLYCNLGSTIWVLGGVHPYEHFHGQPA